MSDAWKVFQRWVCRFFGGECGWRGDDDECYELAGVFAPEVKYRKSLPKWLSGGMEQAYQFAQRAGKPYPILVIGTHRQKRMDSLVVMDLRHFDWIIRDAGLKPPNLNERIDHDYN